MRNAPTGASGFHGIGTSVTVSSCPSGPAMAASTSMQSSTLRQIGPTRSRVHASVIAPYRLTRPYVGCSPTRPQALAGCTIEPPVAVPMLNATSPPAVAAPGPADDPPELRAGPHGLSVRPPNHTLPCANSPVDSF